MEVIDVPLPVRFDRPFFVSSMLSTHRQLLIKSPMGSEYDERVDIVFKGVSAMSLVFNLPKLEVRDATDSETHSISAGLEPRTLGVSGSKLYIVSGEMSRGYIVASAAYMVKVKLHGANPSPLFFDHEDVVRPDIVYRLASTGA